MRLRQAVMVARELESAAQRLRQELSLGEPFRDPGVGQFGLANVVFAIGDCFLEIVSPVQEGTAAGRHLERHGGDGGYMLLFDIEDLEGARERAAALGVRVVWQIDLPDISGTHMHPGDMRGTIVSLDCSRPYGAWRWGGPEWTGRIGTGAPGALLGASVAVHDPHAVCARWGEILGVQPAADGSALVLDGGEVRFERAREGEAEALVEIAVAVPGEQARRELSIGALRLTIEPAAAPVG